MNTYNAVLVSWILILCTILTSAPLSAEVNPLIPPRCARPLFPYSGTQIQSMVYPAYPVGAFSVVNRLYLDAPSPDVGTGFTLFIPDHPDNFVRTTRFTAFAQNRIYALIECQNESFSVQYFELWTSRLDSLEGLVEPELLLGNISTRHGPSDLAADSIGCVAVFYARALFRARELPGGGWVVDSVTRPSTFDAQGELRVNYPWIITNNDVPSGGGPSKLYRWPSDSPLAVVEAGAKAYVVASGDTFYRVNAGTIECLHWHAGTIETLRNWSMPADTFRASSLELASDRSVLYGWYHDSVYSVDLTFDTTRVHHTRLCSAARPVWWKDTLWTWVPGALSFYAFGDTDSLRLYPVPFGQGYKIAPGMLSLKNRASTDQTYIIVNLNGALPTMQRYVMPFRYIYTISAVLGDYMLVIGSTHSTTRKDFYAVDISRPESARTVDSMITTNYYTIAGTRGNYCLLSRDGMAYVIDATNPSDLRIVDSLACTVMNTSSSRYLLISGDRATMFPDSMGVYRWSETGFAFVQWLRPAFEYDTPLMLDNYLYSAFVASRDTTIFECYLRRSPETGLFNADTLWQRQGWVVGSCTIDETRGDTVILNSGEWYVPDLGGHWHRVDSTWARTVVVGDEWVCGAYKDGTNSGPFLWRRYPLSSTPGAALPSVPSLDLALHPNPTSGPLTLTAILPHPGNYTVEVADCLGRTLRSRTVVLREGEAALREDLTEFPTGVYLVRLRGEGSVVGRLVVRE